MSSARVVDATKVSVVVERRIAGVLPSQVYEAVSDVDRMREWSPEGRGRSTAGAQLGVGDAFSGSNRRGWRRWSTACVVTRAEPPHAFAFDVSWAGMPVATWTYEVAPSGDDVLVRESWADRRLGLRGLVVKSAGLLASGVWNRSAHNAESMRATLDALAASLEP